MATHHAVYMQSAPKPPREAGRHNWPPLENVMSSLNAALPHCDMPPLSLRSPAVMESPMNSRRRAAGGGGATKVPSDMNAFTARPAVALQPLRRDSVSRTSVKVLAPFMLQAGSHFWPGRLNM